MCVVCVCVSHHADLESSVVQAAGGQEAVERTPGCWVEIPAEQHRIGWAIREAGQPADLGQQDGELSQLDVSAARVVEEVGVGHADETGGIPLADDIVGSQEHNQSHIVPVEEGVAGAQELNGIGGDEGEAGWFEDDGTSVWFTSCPLLILTLVTWLTQRTRLEHTQVHNHAQQHSKDRSQIIWTAPWWLAAELVTNPTPSMLVDGTSTKLKNSETCQICFSS